MRKGKGPFNEHLIHTLEKTTPYQRMVWLKRAFEFWKKLKTERQDKGFKIS